MATNATRAFVISRSITVFLLVPLLGALGCDGSVPWLSFHGPDRPTLGDSAVVDEPASDDGGGLVTASVDGEDNAGMELSFDAGPGFCCNPLAIEFSAQLSNSHESQRASFHWDFGDGRTGTGASAQHTYMWQGAYDVVLTAMISDSLEIATTQRLTLGSQTTPGENISLGPAVDPTLPTDPTVEGQFTVNAGTDQVVPGGSTVLLVGTVAAPPEGGAVTYHWTQSAGPAVTLTSASWKTASFVAPEAQVDPTVLQFILTATQGGRSVTDVVQVTIEAVDSPPAGSTDNLPDIDQIVEWLRELPPLQKVHYSWPFSGSPMTDPNHPLPFEYVRITHAVTLSGSGPKEHLALQAVRLCKEVNALNPAIPARIAIKYSPWHEVWPPNLPPTDFGPYHDAELALFEENMLLHRQYLEAAYAELNTVIPVDKLIFDSEQFAIKEPDEPGYEEWNAAMNAKYDAFYDIGKSIFPDATIEWFARGAIQPCEDYTRWCPKTEFTLEEKGDTFNCALYYPYATQLMIDTFRQTHQNAVAHGVNEIMLWVSLGAGWDLTRKWHSDLEYDLAGSRDLGAQINDPYYGDHPNQYAPWHDATSVCFWPRPFNVGTPAWGVHFVAYVRGAHGITELP